MRTRIFTAIALAALATGASAAPRHGAHQQGAAKKECCPMCAQMKQEKGKGGMGGGMMGGMMGGKSGGMMGGKSGGMMGGMGGEMMKPGTAGPGTVTVGSDGTVYVLRGGALYKFDADLKLVGQAELPAPPAPKGSPSAAGPGDHQGHH